jgi:hypothetical protein
MEAAGTQQDRTTMDIYAHVMPAMLDEVAAKIEAVLNG